MGSRKVAAKVDQSDITLAEMLVGGKDVMTGRRLAV
jgi:hypothetical protein